MNRTFLRLMILFCLITLFVTACGAATPPAAPTTPSATNPSGCAAFGQKSLDLGSYGVVVVWPLSATLPTAPPYITVSHLNPNSLDLRVDLVQGGLKSVVKELGIIHMTVDGAVVHSSTLPVIDANGESMHIEVRVCNSGEIRIDTQFTPGFDPTK